MKKSKSTIAEAPKSVIVSVVPNIPPPTVKQLPIDQKTSLIQSLMKDIKANEKKIMELAEENDVMGAKIRKLVVENSNPKVLRIVKSLSK